MSNLRTAAEKALALLDRLQHHAMTTYPDEGYREHNRVKNALRAALAAEQPEPVAWMWLQHGKPVNAFLHRPGEHDPNYWSANGFTSAPLYAAPPPPAAAPSEAELPPLPIGEAEVVWHEPDPVMPERPGKIIDASIAFFDAAPLGTHLYTAEQMRDYALRAAAAARNSK